MLSFNIFWLRFLLISINIFNNQKYDKINNLNYDPSHLFDLEQNEKFINNRLFILNLLKSKENLIENLSDNILNKNLQKQIK